MTAADFAKLVTGAKRRTDGVWWDGRCPAHDDQRASLSVRDGDHALIVHCQAGCRREAIAAALGLDVRQFSHRDNGRPESARIAAVYDYRDADGTLRFQVLRVQPKTFRQRRPDGNGGWIWNMQGVERVPYRLDVIARERPATVCIVEGERDVETLERHGLPATTNVGGAGKWRASDAAALVTEGVSCVVVFRDNGVAGVEHEALVARVCYATGLGVKLARLPGLPPVRDKHGEDVTDWLASHTADELRAVIEAAEAWTPAPAPGAPASVHTAQARIAPAEAPHLTDTGNAQRFAREHADVVRYCWPLRRFYVWTGKIWEPDAEGRIYALAKETARLILADALQAPTYEARKTLGAWALKSESEPRLRAMVDLARSEPALVVSPDALDADPWALNVENGIINLKTGDLGSHDPAALCTKLAPVAYDPDADCPRFMKVLDTIFAGRGPLIEFMRRCLGYALVGVATEQVIIVLHGLGANGKTTLLKIFHTILGPYAVSTPPESLLLKREAGIPNDLARLAGARMVSAVEVDGGRRLAENLVKSVTGGDPIVARFLNREFFEFRPTFTLFLSVNRKPRITGRDHAIWRRVRLVPFIVTIPENEQDRTLADQLVAAEGPGILRWLVQGCLAWQREGLGLPDDVRAATQEYRLEQDVLAGFLADRCILEPGAHVGGSALYAGYAAWACTGGERALSRSEFREALLHRDGIVEHRTNTLRGWQGIRLREAGEPEPTEPAEAEAREPVRLWE